MKVHDNGEGNAVDQTDGSRRNGLGLHAMAQRAELLGGAFKMISDPAKGTTVIVDVPLRAA